MQPTEEQLNTINGIGRVLATKYARRLGAIGAREWADFRQVAIFGAYRAHLSFNPRRGTKYSGWLYTNAKGELLHYLRDAVALIRMPRVVFEGKRPRTINPFPNSLDTIYNIEDDDAEPIAYFLGGDNKEDVSLVEMRDLIRRAVPSPQARLIVELYWLQDCKQTDIGAMFHISQKQVSRTLRNTKPRLEQALARVR